MGATLIASSPAELDDTSPKKPKSGEGVKFPARSLTDPSIAA